MGVFDLPILHVNSWIFNCYVIETPAGLVVIDPGLPVVAKLAHAAANGRPITSIACTHGHPDHVGGVATLTELNRGGADDMATNTPPSIALPARCEAYLAGEEARTFPLIESSLRFMPVYGEQRFSLRAMTNFATASRRVGYSTLHPFTIDFSPTTFLSDNDDLPGAPDWQVIHAPGHADEAMCLYHAESETLISGDAVVSHDGQAWFNPEFVSLDDSEATEERLRALPVRHLLPGHGRPITATDVWSSVRRPLESPTGSGILTRCARRFGRWA